MRVDLAPFPMPLKNHIFHLKKSFKNSSICAHPGQNLVTYNLIDELYGD